MLTTDVLSGRRVRFNYISMNNPEPHERILEPHSIIKTGRRWHVCGY